MLQFREVQFIRTSGRPHAADLLHCNQEHKPEEFLPDSVENEGDFKNSLIIHEPNSLSKHR